MRRTSRKWMWVGVSLGIDRLVILWWGLVNDHSYNGHPMKLITKKRLKVLFSSWKWLIRLPFLIRLEESKFPACFLWTDPDRIGRVIWELMIDRVTSLASEFNIAKVITELVQVWLGHLLMGKSIGLISHWLSINSIALTLTNSVSFLNEMIGKWV